MSQSRIKQDALEADKLLQQMAEADTAERAKAQGDVEAENARRAALSNEGDNGGDPDNTPAPVTNIKPAEDDWAQRYRTLQGMFAKVNEDNALLRGRVDEISRSRNEPAPAPPTAPQAKRFVTDEEVKDYGAEFIDVTKRAAREIYDDKMEAMQRTIAELQSKVGQAEAGLGQVARSNAESLMDRFYATLNTKMPSWEKINNDPNFLTWLNETDIFTGVSRQVLLTQAFNAKDSGRTLAFFEKFAESSGAVKSPTQPRIDAASLISPDTVSSGAPQSNNTRGRIYTQADIEKIYDDKIAGKITHEKFLALEKDAMQALAEGRVR